MLIVPVLSRNNVKSYGQGGGFNLSDSVAGTTSLPVQSISLRKSLSGTGSPRDTGREYELNYSWVIPLCDAEHLLL